MLRRENQKRGHFPLDEYRNEQERPIRSYISRLWYVKDDAAWENRVAVSVQKEAVLEVEVEADNASNASGQAAQDYAKEANQAVGGNLSQKLFEGRAIWMSDIAPRS